MLPNNILRNIQLQPKAFALALIAQCCLIFFSTQAMGKVAVINQSFGETSSESESPTESHSKEEGRLNEFEARLSRSPHQRLGQNRRAFLAALTVALALSSYLSFQQNPPPRPSFLTTHFAPNLPSTARTLPLLI